RTPIIFVRRLHPVVWAWGVEERLALGKDQEFRTRQEIDHKWWSIDVKCFDNKVSSRLHCLCVPNRFVLFFSVAFERVPLHDHFYSSPHAPSDSSFRSSLDRNHFWRATRYQDR